MFSFKVLPVVVSLALAASSVATSPLVFVNTTVEFAATTVPATLEPATVTVVSDCTAAPVASDP